VTRAIKLLISLIFFGADNLCRMTMRLCRKPCAGRLVVIFYHSVPPAVRGRFAQQMKAISRAGKVLPAHYVGPLEPGRRHVAITFDDAFESVADNAVPELVKHSFPATIFVPSGVMGRSPDWDMELNHAERTEVVMTAQKLQTLPADLITLGSHSITHPRLPELSDADLKDELFNSRRQLEATLDRPVQFLAFPYGAHDERVVKECRAAGYERVFSLAPRLAAVDGRDFVRGRIRVDPPDTALEFFLKIRGAYAWMPYASALLRKLGRKRQARIPLGQG
jgi:peptidoglycan/xylan/chitin deacetylase (PgdA/CDA1 family)